MSIIIHFVGPQQQAGFGATPFSIPVSSTPSLFGQPDASKPAFGQATAFGQTNSTFGQTTGFGLASQQQQTNLFGKPTGKKNEIKVFLFLMIFHLIKKLLLFITTLLIFLNTYELYTCV